MMFETGRDGLAKDERRARTVFERGCTGGNAPGCTNLDRRRLASTRARPPHRDSRLRSAM